MSSPEGSPKHAIRLLPRPPTPGPIFNNAGELLDRNHLHGYDQASPSRLASIDLANSPPSHPVWIEMEQTLPTNEDYGDTRKLLGGARSRSSSITSVSSDASSVRAQGQAQRHITSCIKGLPSLASFTIVQKLYNLFERIDSMITTYQSNSRFHGWKMGVLIGCCTSTTILLFNIAVVIIVVIKTDVQGDTAQLPFKYNSQTMSRLSSGIHLLINALSTILLAASNYTMQVLTSPTRKDLDKAHLVGQWFDVGVLSVRNLKRIPRKQLILCLLMGLTSIPLHLFYNSVAIYIASTNDYQFNLLNHKSPEWQKISSNESYTALNNREWQDAYKSDLIQYGDLYLAFNETAVKIADNATGYPIDAMDMPSDTNMTIFRNRGGNQNSIAALTSKIKSYSWINLHNAFPEYLPSVSPTVVNYAHIIGARAFNVPSRSRIQLSLRYMIIVIICNVVKLAIMLWALFLDKSDFIVTLGDGAASYLEHPDANTEKVCVFTKDAVLINCGPQHDMDRTSDVLDELLQDTNGIWKKQYRAYSSSLNRDREVGSSFIFIVMGMTFLFCVAFGLAGTISGSWGSASTTILGGSNGNPQDTLVLAWLANTPQLVLSFCYLAINSECTSMAGAREWNQLGTCRKGLRVTKPTHEQRSTYFLQLPYKISLPLIYISGGLHWLLSQSLFLVRIDHVDRNNTLDPSNSRSGIGISGLSFMVFCMSFYVLVVVVGLVGRHHLRVRIPFAASCSLVISAACHPPSDDQGAHLRQVKWGVVKEKMFDGKLHCTLSSQPVSKPKEGTSYR